MSFLSQLIQLLSEAPGSIVYHLVTLLAVQATLGLAAWQWRRDPADKLAQRLLWLAGGVLFSRLIIIFTILITGDTVEAVQILPPLERALDAANVILLLWALVPHLENLPRLADALLAIILLFIGILYIFFARDWYSTVANQLAGIEALTVGYNNSPQATVWTIFIMALLFTGGVLILLGRENYRPLRLAIITILFGAHLGHFWPGMAAGDTDVAYWARLGHLAAYPLLALLAYRHNLTRLLADQAVGRLPAERIAQQLSLSRHVIHSLDVSQTMQRALPLVADLVDAEFIAVAVTSLDDTEQLNLVSLQPRDNAASQLIRRQNWAVRLRDWPSFRLAMQQRQRVELIPNGLGARQLHDLYRELDAGSLGALLIEPLLVDNNELGVLLLAAEAGQERWPANSKALTGSVATYLAQALDNARRYQLALREQSSISVADEDQVSGRVIALEQARDKAVAEQESLLSRLKHTESRLVEEEQRSRRLAEVVTELESFNRDDQISALQSEAESLRDSLVEAEEALALAAAGESGLSAEWVMLAITRYSGELEEAQARINRLEQALTQQSQTAEHENLAALAQELLTPLTSLAGYTELLLGQSMGHLNEKQAGLLRRMQANIQQMEGLLDQIIQAARKEQPAIPDINQVDIRQSLETALMGIMNQLRQKSLRLDLNISGELPPAYGDRDSLEQIFSYLFNHVCLASDQDGRLQISARTDSMRTADVENEPMRFLHVAVSDESPQVNPALQSLVTASYRQPQETKVLPPYIDRQTSAAILNLTAHGGRIWLENPDGRGNRFSVLLPVSENGQARAHANGAQS